MGPFDNPSFAPVSRRIEMACREFLRANGTPKALYVDQKTFDLLGEHTEFYWREHDKIIFHIPIEAIPIPKETFQFVAETN